MAEQKKPVKRNKPKFLRQDNHKMIKLGKGLKKKQTWRHPKGRHSKIRLGRNGHARKVKVGWGSDKNLRVDAPRIENLSQLNNLKDVKEIILGNIGKKKREEIIKKAAEMKIKVLNRYKALASVPSVEGKEGKSDKLEVADATS